MNILLVGPEEYNSTDGVIVKGIKNLILQAQPSAKFAYIYIDDHRDMHAHELQVPSFVPDSIVVCGTPWLWDKFYFSHKYKNLCRLQNIYNQGTILMGIGTCMNEADRGQLLTSPEDCAEVKAFITSAHTVIFRDYLSARIAKRAIGNTYHVLPCPGHFAMSEPAPAIHYNRAAIYIDPTKSISAGDWTDPTKLKEFDQKFIDFKPTQLYVAKREDIPRATALGLGEPILLTSVTNTLQVVRSARTLLSGRVHCAIPARVSNCKTTLIPIDTRADAFYDFQHVVDFRPYHEQYMKILQTEL